MDYSSSRIFLAYEKVRKKYFAEGAFPHLYDKVKPEVDVFKIGQEYMDPLWWLSLVPITHHSYVKPSCHFLFTYAFYTLWCIFEELILVWSIKVSS